MRVGSRMVMLLGCMTWFGFTSSSVIAQSQIRIHGISAGNNGDNTSQAIEIRVAPGETNWGEESPGSGSRAELAFYDAAGTEFFVFPLPSDAPQSLATADLCGLTSVLITTPSFASSHGIAPDILLPTAQGATLSQMHTQGGAVCFRGTGNPGSLDINVCVAYGAPQVCAISGNCCRDDADCPDAGDSCLLAPDIANGLIPFTASVSGTQSGFNGTPTGGASGCPTAALPLTGVSGLQQAEPVGGGCCVGEACHRNADFTLVDNPVWKNAAGATASIVETSSLTQGEAVFNTGTFNGNLRTCQRCHLTEDGFGLRPESITSVFNTDPLNSLFAAENNPDVPDLESPCMMRMGDQRGLILENVLGDPPAFRASMHLMNIEDTAPYGWSPCFGGADDLIAFCQTAVGQHTPRVFPRNNDPTNGSLLSNRAATIEELTFMEEFQFTIKTQVNDGLGDLKGRLDGECVGGDDDGVTCGPCPGVPPVCPPDQCNGGTCVVGTSSENREDNLDRLIAQYLGFCSSASPTQIADGRQRFIDAECATCHMGPMLDDMDVQATGIVDHPSNLNTGCPIGCAGGECELPNENQLCADCGDQCPGCDGLGCASVGIIEFDVRPLIDVARIKKGVSNPNLGSFFHDSAARTLREAVEFYQSPESRVPVDPSTPEQINDIVAFLSALVEVGDPSVCPPPLPVCSEVRRLRARCTSDGGVSALVVFGDESHDGQRVTVGINGVPMEAGIVGRLASLDNCCNTGIIEVSLIEPPSCVAPVFIECIIETNGTCCSSEGVCGFNANTQSQCENAGGTFLGTDVSCSPNPCAQPATGACCIPDGTCAVTTEANCTGLYSGDDTVCDPDPCPEPTGACCFMDGTCTELTEPLCLDAGGLYSGNGTGCTPNVCPQPTGACCAHSGVCTEVTQDECTAVADSVYQGDFTICVPDLCPLPTGACCFSDESCLVDTQPACASLLGTYRGDDTNCNPNPCPTVPPPVCADIRRLRGRCNSDGSTSALVVLDNTLHDGQTVIIAIAGELFEVPIVGRLADVTSCCPVGTFDVELVEPSGCVTPVPITCPNP